MRVGIFGGAFDPVHVGHLILAERVRDEAGLGLVRFLPSYKPPHKADRQLTRFETRCDMVTLATTGQPAFVVDAVEKELPPPSFSVRYRFPKTTSRTRTGTPRTDFIAG